MADTLSIGQLAAGGGFTALLLSIGGFLGRQLTKFVEERLQANHKAELARMQEEKTAELDRLADGYKAELARAQAVHQAALDAIAADHNSKLRQLEEAYRSALEVERTIDTDLRIRRIETYQSIWAGMRLLPKWPRAKITLQQLEQFTASLRDWYFLTGGVYLSTQAQAAYVDLQETIRTVLVAGSDESRLLTDTEYDQVRDACSALRTELTADIESRRPAPTGAQSRLSGQRSQAAAV